MTNNDHNLPKNVLYLKIYSILLIILTPIDYLLFLSWIETMKNYLWYSSSLVFPFFSILFFSLGTTWFFYKNKISHINKLNQKDIIKLSILDGLSSQISSFSIPFLSVVSITILDKLTLPLNMLVSKLYLKKVYFKNHYLSLFLTIFAIMITFIPSFQENRDNYWWAIILYILSIFPSVGSFVYKDKLLVQPINIWWMNTYISIWQFIFGLLLLPLMFIPVGIKNLNYIPPSEFADYMKDGSKCQFLGINSRDKDECQLSFVLMMSYQIISTLINIIMFEIIKHGSSTYFILINCLKIPIQFWLGSIKSLAGENYSPVNINNLFTAILLIVSILVYNDTPEGTETNHQFNSLDYNELNDNNLPGDELQTFTI